MCRESPGTGAGITPRKRQKHHIHQIFNTWRREWDSNPRYSFPYTRFPSERLQPLGHPSAALSRCSAVRRSGGGRTIVAGSGLARHCRAIRFLQGRAGGVRRAGLVSSYGRGPERSCKAAAQATMSGPMSETDYLLRPRSARSGPDRAGVFEIASSSKCSAGTGRTSFSGERPGHRCQPSNQRMPP
jgi:hypothetical protein